MMRFRIYSENGAYLGRTLAGCSMPLVGNEVHVLYMFDSEDLKYSISNPAFVQGDIARVMDSYGHDHLGDDKEHLMHQWIDVCEDGNWDRVRETVLIAISDIELMLYRFASHRISGSTSMDSDPELQCEYTIELSVPPSLGDAPVLALQRYFREYIVAAVLEAWGGITYPEAVPYWSARKIEIENKIRGAVRMGNVAKWTTPSMI